MLVPGSIIPHPFTGLTRLQAPNSPARTRLSCRTFLLTECRAHDVSLPRLLLDTFIVGSYNIVGNLC